MCGQPIEWVVNERNGHAIPVNPTPSDAGTIMHTGARDWRGRPIVHVHASAAVAAATGIDKPRLVNHLKVCRGRRG
jgi:hypothetical protein